MKREMLSEEKQKRYDELFTKMMREFEDLPKLDGKSFNNKINLARRQITEKYLPEIKMLFEEAIDIDEIYEKAHAYFKRECGIDGLCAGIETEDYYVFSAGNPNIINYGGTILGVNKKDLSIEILEPTNMSFLANAKKLDIPEKYMYKEC